MVTRTLSLLIVFALVMPMLVAQGTPADDKIYDLVRTKLANDPDVKGAGLDITVKAGVVTLRGLSMTIGRRRKPASSPRA
jgi:osmotically-inducible protein OsmY